MVPFQGPNAPSPPQALTARIYGTKNVYSGLIRLYAAYHLTTSPQLYDLTAWTYAGVLGLYGLEIAVYGTSRWREGGVALGTAGLGLVWMIMCRDFYVG